MMNLKNRPNSLHTTFTLIFVEDFEEENFLKDENEFHWFVNLFDENYHHIADDENPIYSVY